MNVKRSKNVVMLLSHDFLRPYADPRVYKEAKSLVGKKYDVSVVCWHEQGKNLPAYEEYEGIKVFRIFQSIPHYTTSLFWRFPFYKLYVFKSVVRSLKLKPYIIHCHDLDTLIIGVILKLFRKSLIFDAHEDFPGMLEWIYSKRLGHLARLCEKILIKFADRVIAAEMPYTDIMKKHYGKTPVVVMNLPRLDSFHPKVDPSSVIRQYGLEGKVVISHIGGIGRNRGIYETLEALQYLESDDFRYLLIGRTTSEEWDRIRETIHRFSLEDKVVPIIDGVSYQDIPRYYKASDISMVLLYPIPNYVVSLPTKLFESLAVGTPVLAANLDYLNGVVTKHGFGLCADPKDPEDIAAKLNTLISDKQARLRMGQNGLRAIQGEFNWDESEKRLIELYEGMETPKPALPAD
ncbi:glycosyltransferase family 4 protein [Chloroflexota bacterium]